MCKSYDYTVEYGGVGAPAPGREDVGPCSQMATFIESTKANKRCENIQLSSYQMVCSLNDCQVPYAPPPLSHVPGR